MKVTVKDIAVRYKDDRYEKGETLTIQKEHFDDVLFVLVEEPAEEEPAEEDKDEGKTPVTSKKSKGAK